MDIDCGFDNGAGEFEYRSANSMTDPLVRSSVSLLDEVVATWVTLRNVSSGCAHGRRLQRRAQLTSTLC
jgi:hypothetical protein